MPRRRGKPNPPDPGDALLADLARALRTAALPDGAVAQALATLASTPFEGADAEGTRLRTTLAVHGLSAVWHWRHADGLRDEQDPAVLALRSLQQQLEQGGPNGVWVEAAGAAARGVYSLDDKHQALARATLLLALLGVAVDHALAAPPTLRPLCELFGEALTVSAQPDDAAPSGTPADEPAADADPSDDSRAADHEAAEPDLATRCNTILTTFAQRIDADGFSQYTMEQAIAELRGLPLADEADATLLNQALVILVDVALPFAPPDGQAALQAAREALVRMAEAPATPLGTTEVQAGCEAIVTQLEAALAAGENPSGAVTRAITDLQMLGQRIADGDDAAGMAVMAAMPRVLAAAAGAAPPELRAQAEQMSAHFDDVVAAAPRLMESVGDEQAIEAQAAQATLDRLAATTADNLGAGPADPLMRQIAAVLRSWTPRLAALHDEPAGTHDETEARRLAKRIAAALRPAGAATTEAQLIEQMRHALRPLALALRRFERRRHLTLIAPPWPAQPVVDEPNALFASAGSAVQALVDAVAARLGMAAPPAIALDDPTHARWLQLRAAAVAVFDFSAYDRARADPSGALPREAAAQTAILQAAAPVAAVAFEAGWALLLGVPMVIVAHEGQAVPFDIDIAPVRLQGNEDDAVRLAQAVVRAQFGAQRVTQRNVAGDGLAHTLNALRHHAGADAQAASLLSAVADCSDAMRVQFAAQAVLDRPGIAPALLVCPAFAAQAPAAAATLFHVSGFRDWSLPVQQAVRAACERAGIHYRIGHEDLDPAILRAVWAGLAQASFVVADLTTLNPNAVLELAIAQAMGRPTLILSRHADTAQVLPALAKQRIHSYDVDAAGLQALGRLLDRFLSEPGR